MGLIFLKNSKVGMFFLISISFISCKSYQKIGGENSNYIPYYLKVYEADSLFLVKNYSSAYEKYDSLFKYYEPINMPLYFEFENYIKSGLLAKKDKSFKKEFKKALDVDTSSPHCITHPKRKKELKNALISKTNKIIAAWGEVKELENSAKEILSGGLAAW